MELEEKKVLTLNQVRICEMRHGKWDPSKKSVITGSRPSEMFDENVPGAGGRGRQQRKYPKCSKTDCDGVCTYP